MKKTLAFCIAVCLVLVACKVVNQPKRISAIDRGVKLPPSPPGLKIGTSKALVPYVPPKLLAPSYVPTDFAIDLIKIDHGNIVINWINGTPPFQVESKNGVSGTWVNFGPVTSMRRMTNPPPYGLGTAIFRVRYATQPGQLQFVKQHSAGFATGNGSALAITARSGDFISGGQFFGTITFDTITISTVGGQLDGDGYLAKYDSQGRALWAKGIGGQSGDDAVTKVTTDSQGNIIATGGFYGVVDFGGTVVTAASANPDAFVSKYGTNNPPNLIWAKRFGGSGNDFGYAVRTDSSGDVFFGSTISSIDADFGGIVLVSAGGDDIAIAKLSGSTGSTIWAKRWGGTMRERMGGLAVDRSGDIWVSGSFSGTADLGSGLVSSLPANQKIFLARYSGSDGSYRTGSLRTMGTSGLNGAKDVVVDPLTGNVIITGGCVGAVDFGGGSPVKIADLWDTGTAFFVAVYDSSGNYLWAKELGTQGSTLAASGSSVAATGGSVTITGQSGDGFYTGSQWFIGGGYFLATFDSSGTFQWGRIASGGPSQGTGVAFDSQGHIVTAGSSVGPVNFGPGPNGQNILGTSPGGVTASFVGQYTK